MAEAEEEEKPAIVLDYGSGMLKAGFAGDDAPRCVFPAIVGRPKYEVASRMVGCSRVEAYVGDVAQRKRGILNLTYPSRHGVVENWEDMEKIWHHAFYNELRVAPEDQPVLISESTLNKKENREKMAELMFESFHVPALYISLQAILSVYASGRNTAVVLESGDGVTHVLPITEGHCMTHSVQRINFGGRQVTEYLARLLRGRGCSFTTSAELEVVKAMKEEVCFVAKDYQEEINQSESSSSLEKTYELPDGNVITVNKERFQATEPFFQTGLMGMECPSFPQLVIDCIQKCDMDVRKHFCCNILLSGGNTLFQGMQQRMQLELQKLIPDKSILKVLAPPERLYSVWIGGSILASLSTFQNMWITKQQYEEEGPQIIHKGCF